MKLTYSIFCLFVIVLIFHPMLAEAESFSIDQVDIHAFLLDNGDLYVEELFTYHFEGEFNGTTRTIGNDDHQGVKFFEGYLAPKDMNLLNYNPNTLEPLKVEREDLTYKVHTASKDETKKVFYRYLIEGAATKYEDTGQFYWRFFDEMNESDLHHLTIRMALYHDPSTTLKGQAFLHDLTGGSLKKSSQYGFIYENKLLPAEKTVEIRYLFPEEFLKNASFTENEPMLSTFLNEEEAYQEWFAKRSRWEPVVENINDVFLGMAILLLFITIFYPRRLYRLFDKGVPIANLGEMDSFTLAVLHRKSQLQHNDIISSLFRLHQSGILSMEHTLARASYLEDEEAPDHTYHFTLLKDEQKLRNYERDIIDWLFTIDNTGKKSFSLDQLPFPTKTERQKNWRLEKEYKQAEKKFHQTFKKWRKSVLHDQEIKKYVRVNPIRKWLIIAGSPLWILYSLLSAWMGKADLYNIVLILLFLTGGLAMMYIKKERRFALLAYLFIGSIITSLFTYEIDFMYITVSTALVVTALFVPVLDITMKGVPYFKGIQSFKKAIRSGNFDFESSKGKMEKWYQHALSLNLFIELKIRYANIFSEQIEGLSPLLKISAETTDIFQYPHHHYYHTYSSQSSGGSSGSGSSGSSGGSGGGGGAGAF
ncbi:DUF2207 domain-containing protein [Bacillus sp. FJAT-49705]|uniref:DUF2207 domain-containing protein n=1 Tax=Cytobacillus citreus TaxID=2833586 RepID=A0ABS5NZN6_9BACI|nr:DUF2207 domain-containing protein [Cytobacillus citreus]MBS4193312.1 DUF2207 domain-containing protein [Cytobacillus citreus]